MHHVADRNLLCAASTTKTLNPLLGKHAEHVILQGLAVQGHEESIIILMLGL